MKIVLSDRIYCKLPDGELGERIKKRFIHSLFTSPGKPPRYIYRFGHIAKGTYWFPIGSLPILEEEGLEVTEIVDKRLEVPVEIPEPKFTLREDQQNIVKSVSGNCLINAAPGFGKSITGLAIAHKLQQKTLIVCTTTIIRDMWVAEIKKWFGFSPGVIGSGQYNIDSPIVVGNIQTLSKHTTKLISTFGLVIIDEAHHIVASTFTRLLDLSRAKYKIGLSGTLKRKDGLEVTFPGFFSPKIISPEVNNIMPITVHRYNTDIKLPGNMLTPWALRVNDLYALNSYYRLVQLLANAYREVGHKVLVVADRVELLNSLYEEDSGAKYIITGQKDHADLEYRNSTMSKIAKSDAPTTLYASTSIFSEGVSLNELSCIVVCNPTNNESLIKQLAGRVMRIVEGKIDPIYVELVLKGDTGKKHQSQRSGFFASWDWKVVNMDSRGLLEYKRQLTES